MGLLSRLRKTLTGSGGAEAAAAHVAGEPPRPGDQLTLAQAWAAYEAGARFVDVREPSEWAQGHIAGATNRPVSEIEKDTGLPADTDALVVTYCVSGARAARAAALIAASGHARVQSLSGGYPDWAQAGYPIEADDGQPSR